MSSRRRTIRVRDLTHEHLGTRLYYETWTRGEHTEAEGTLVHLIWSTPHDYTGGTRTPHPDGATMYIELDGEHTHALTLRTRETLEIRE